MAKRAGTNGTETVSRQREDDGCFVVEMPLRTTAADERRLEIRFHAAQQIYNAVLGESLRRLTLMRQSRAWQRARAMPRHLGTDKDGKPIVNKVRTAAFKACAECFGFRGFDLQKYAEATRDACWIGDHLGSHDTQSTAARAFAAVQMYAFGKRGRPRFKGKRGLHSVEGKSNKAVIRYRDGMIHWAGLDLPVLRDATDRDGWQAEALSRPTKLCRIVRRELRGRIRWFVQLVQAGQPPVKRRHLQQRAGTHGCVVGLDIGPSTIAHVGERAADLCRLAPSVEQPWAAARVLQRGLDRCRRAKNPEHFLPDGRVKPGPKRWADSGKYKERARRLRETERRLAAARKRDHGAVANAVLAQGNHIKTEKLSYKAFQKRFGRSVKVRAPGLLIATIARKAESAGGAMEDFSTRTTRLSQYCHQADAYVKKPLSQRWHVFPDGSRVQRDLYSAWLARFVHRNTLDTGQVCENWPAADQLLRRAGSRFMQSASVSRSSGDHGQSVGVDRPPKSLERGDGAASAPSSSGARSTRAHRGRDHARRTGGLHPVREGREKATPARDKGTSGLQAGE